MFEQIPGLSQSISAESCSMSEYYDAVEENNLELIESASETSSEVIDSSFLANQLIIKEIILT